MSFATPAAANIIWPALYLVQRSLSPWIIGFGLIVEFAAVWAWYRLDWRRTAVFVILMNMLSALAGALLIPIAGILWALTGERLTRLYDHGTFSPSSWVATLVMAVLINAWLESRALRWLQLEVDRRSIWMLVAANTVSVGAAIISLQFWGVRQT